MNIYLEDQQLEIEALESLFPNEGEFIKLSKNEFNLHLYPQLNYASTIYVDVILHITYSETYPITGPEWSLTHCRGLDAIQQDELKDIIKTEINHSLGYPMIYTVAEAIQNYLSDHNAPEQSNYDQMMSRHLASSNLQHNNQYNNTTSTVNEHLLETKLYTADINKSGEEDSGADSDDLLSSDESESFKGLDDKDLCDTEKRITENQFKVWKEQFEKDMILKGIWKNKQLKISKLSGKQLFERDASLITSAMDEDLKHDIKDTGNIAWKDEKLFMGHTDDDLTLGVNFSSDDDSTI